MMTAEQLEECAARVAELALSKIQERGLSAGMPAEPESLPWVPMVKGVQNRERCEELARRNGIPLESLLEIETWLNDRYQCSVRRCRADPARPDMIHLSIRRHDRAACHDWRDFQRIKNDVIGPEHEAVELYPADSRLVDSANQYHLWALAEAGVSFPLGFLERDVTHPAEGTLHKQRPWAPGEEPEQTEAKIFTRTM